MLRKAASIPKGEVWAAHVAAKSQLFALVKNRTGRSLSPDILTIGFARRATPYKRADLVFRDVNRLLDIADDAGPLQFVFAGKAHPRDNPDKDVIQRIIAASRRLRNRLEIVYLENYDVDLAKFIISGVDLWLNTPQRPLEASGTSGMKAAHNGVLNFSILDGWWMEGHIEGVTGWSIGAKEAGSDPEIVSSRDSEDLYQKLKMVIVPMFYRDRERWEELMQQSIALNASHFNTHRMVQQYVTNAYLP
jgi:starch phosphorylase